MWAEIKLYRKECVSDLLCFSYVCFPFHFHANDVTEYDHHSGQTVFFGVGKTNEYTGIYHILSEKF